MRRIDFARHHSARAVTMPLRSEVTCRAASKKGRKDAAPPPPPLGKKIIYKSTTASYFRPRTLRQREYRDLLHAPDPSIVVATGPAGTAKTFGAVMVGLEKLMAGEVSPMVLTRPAVGADEDLGFLPGDLEDKMRAWLLPVVDALRVYMSPEEVETLLETSAGGRIEICSLAHMRGRTLRDAYVVVDECQNTTPSQMLMCLTRIGEGSKFVFTGDPAQHDRGGGSGLVDFMTRHAKMTSDEGKKDAATMSLADLAVDLFPVPDKEEETETSDRKKHIELFPLGTEDIQRHASIAVVLSMYDAL